MRISDWSSDVCSSDLERLRPGLDALVRDGALDGYDMAARYLPSAAVQRARQAKLPDAATLQAALDAALADSPFRADVFGEFIEDVATARTPPPLAPADLAGTDPKSTRPNPSHQWA